MGCAVELLGVILASVSTSKMTTDELGLPRAHENTGEHCSLEEYGGYYIVTCCLFLRLFVRVLFHLLPVDGLRNTLQASTCTTQPVVIQCTTSFYRPHRVPIHLWPDEVGLLVPPALFGVGGFGCWFGQSNLFEPRGRERPSSVLLFLVAMPGAPSSFLSLVVRPGAPSSVLAPRGIAGFF